MTSELAGLPERSELPGLSELAGLPESPERPESPELSGLPALPKLPDLPERPELEHPALPALLIDADLTSPELDALFHASWPGHRDTDFGPVFARRLLHVTARRAGRLVGYVNVVGDGGAHAFLLDTTVHPDERRKGLGVALVRAAADAARARGAHWLHVDFEPRLARFYEECGFRPTAASLMALTGPDA
ncbi:GNAT family N-acetyltransferase [Streptomyces sp. NPDC094032]|uniref:GNAT family N-acetyltransferase n=1 Tax=Streptomyces sp. NPDC094032 TaxID=3155308 RepID=UPI003327F93D